MFPENIEWKGVGYQENGRFSTVMAPVDWLAHAG
jgi:hypothetical protein